ncbi:DUF3068 domain-containing protein [Actinomadura sp. HBU206391]|uniref:DUF3068 domain-containing protein n=1 Tax=Actinomadura sp. HBU206391 TaxID=2731692 RepID=UPI00164F778F|nr:DUF3068 domain-containing protein [Actinomadura sp. HBU206391]MBC6456824.1 DUF3068 domain-containing protein [Actinomadura sp. HBU206391]
MRRTLGWVALVLGFSLIALAPLQRFYVAEQLIGVPKDTYQKSTLEAAGASYFDADTAQMRTGATLVATNTTAGNAKASTDDVTVLDSFTVLEDLSTGKQVEVQVQKAALNRKTSELTNCCGAGIGSQTGFDSSVRQSGLGISWPIADVEKKSYQFFDTTTKRTWPMNFEGEEKIQGLDTYKFVMHVGPTAIAKIDGFSGQLLGLDAKQNYPVDRVYEANVSMWVDPRTGAPVNREQQVTTTLRTSDGTGSMTAASFNLKMTPDSQKALVKTADESAQLISMLRTITPVASLLIGAALAAAGIFLIRRSPGRGRDAAPDA